MHPATEYDAFAFANAIMEGKSDIALGILADYRFRRLEPVIILGEVIRVVCNMVNVRALTVDGAVTADISTALKMHEYQVGLLQKTLRQASSKRIRRLLDACLTADSELKQSFSKGYAPLERLICSI